QGVSLSLGTTPAPQKQTVRIQKGEEMKHLKLLHAASPLGKRCALSLALLTIATGTGKLAAEGGGGGTPASLKTVPIPAPSDLSSYVTDSKTLVALGKALFWDMQTGNDGKQACASCHFHAGADHRRTNQINPKGTSFAVNYTLGALDFPFHAGQVGGSAGVPDRQFIDVVAGNAVDDGFSVLDPVYS